MANEDKNKKPQISAAPVVIATTAKPAVAQVKAAATTPALKAPTDTRLKPETIYTGGSSVASTYAPDAPSVEETAFKRLIQLDLLNNRTEVTQPLSQWVEGHKAQLGSNFDVKDPIDMASAGFHRVNPTDREMTSAYEERVQIPYVFNPRTPSTNHVNRTAPQAIIDDGFRTPTFKLDKQQARADLAADIKTVSEMYAADAGISAKDLARVLGGIATIESRFGVARSVTGTKYESSAGGAFHYLNGTIAAEVRQSLSDPRIASRVSTLGVNVVDGVSKSEAWTLKDDNVLAGSILARRVVDTLRRNPELRNDVEALTTRVYQAHNLGDAGAAALARGGRKLLNDESMANNPMFFKGAESDEEVQSRYKRFVAAAITSSGELIENAFAKPTAVLVASSKANLPAPALEPS